MLSKQYYATSCLLEPEQIRACEELPISVENYAAVQKCSGE